MSPKEVKKFERSSCPVADSRVQQGDPVADSRVQQGEPVAPYMIIEFKRKDQWLRS